MQVCHRGYQRPALPIPPKSHSHLAEASHFVFGQWGGGPIASPNSVDYLLSLDLTISKVMCKRLKEKSHQQSFPSAKPSDHIVWPGKISPVVQRSTRRTTESCVIEFEIQSVGENSCPVLKTQPTVSGWRGHRPQRKRHYRHLSK